MSVFHIPLSDIKQMEWWEVVYYHERALEFWKTTHNYQAPEPWQE